MPQARRPRIGSGSTRSQPQIDFEPTSSQPYIGSGAIPDRTQIEHDTRRAWRTGVHSSVIAEIARSSSNDFSCKRVVALHVVFHLQLVCIHVTHIVCQWVGDDGLEVSPLGRGPPIPWAVPIPRPESRHPCEAASEGMALDVPCVGPPKLGPFRFPGILVSRAGAGGSLTAPPPAHLPKSDQKLAPDRPGSPMARAGRKAPPT